MNYKHVPRRVSSNHTNILGNITRKPNCQDLISRYVWKRGRRNTVADELI